MLRQHLLPDVVGLIMLHQTQVGINGALNG